MSSTPGAEGVRAGRRGAVSPHPGALGRNRTHAGASADSPRGGRGAPKEVKDQGVIAVVSASMPVHFADAVAEERLIQSCLVRQLRVCGRERLELDRHLCAGLLVGAQMHLAEGAAPYQSL